MKRLSKSYQTDGFNINTDTELKAIQAKYPECSKDKLVNFEKNGMSGFGEVGYKFNEHNNDLSVYVIESFVFMDVDKSQGQQINKLVYIAQKLDVSNENIDNEPMYVSDAFVNEGKNTFNLQARKRYLAKFQTNLNIKPLKNECKNYQDLKTELIKELGKEKVEQGLAYEQGRTLEDAHKEFNKLSSFKRLVKSTLFDGQPMNEKDLEEELKIKKLKSIKVQINTELQLQFSEPLFGNVSDEEYKDVNNAIDIIGLNNIEDKCSEISSEILFGSKCSFTIQRSMNNSVELLVSISSGKYVDFDKKWIKATPTQFKSLVRKWYKQCMPLIKEAKDDIYNSIENKNDIIENEDITINEVENSLIIKHRRISKYEFIKQYGNGELNI